MTLHAQKLLDQNRSLMLATVSADGTPHVSYAPYVRRENAELYVFVSELAEHTRNLLRTGVASAIIIEDESGADEIFARKRLTLECRATEIIREQENFHTTIADMRIRLGETMDILSQLPDFHLFALVPYRGTVVTGFAAATSLDHDSAPDLIPGIA